MNALFRNDIRVKNSGINIKSYSFSYGRYSPVKFKKNNSVNKYLPNKDPLDPCIKKLLLSLLNRSILDLGIPDPQAKKCAIRWFRNGKIGYFTFLDVCGYLRIDPKKIRVKLLELYPDLDL